MAKNGGSFQLHSTYRRLSREALVVALMTTPTHVFLFGPPGSGKSTQGALLSEYLQIPHFSIGELLRVRAQGDSAEALAIAEKMKTGDLVDDSTVYDTLKTHLKSESTRNGFILDGFPRTEQQIPMLERLAGELALKDYVALDISVPAEITRTRLLQRGRADDTPSVIDARLERYEDTAAPILRYFNEKGKLRVIDGRGDIEQVAKEVRELFEE